MQQLDLYQPDPPNPRPKKAMARSRQSRPSPREIGIAGAKAGMEQAQDHADDVIPGWSEMAGSIVRQYAAARASGTEFVTPELRRYATECGLPHPPSARAWGGVMCAAARAGIIRRVGFRYYGDERMHLQSVVVWEVA